MVLFPDAGGPIKIILGTETEIFVIINKLTPIH